MLSINAISLGRLNNGAHYVFIDYVLQALQEQSVPAESTLAGLVKNLNEAHVAEDEALKVSTKNVKSDAIREADASRDAAYMGIKQIVKGYTKHPDEAHAAAAKELIQLFKSYGIKVNMQLDRETGMLTNLVTDLETKFAPQVKLLGIETFVGHLKQANEQVYNLLVSRDKDYAQTVVGALKKARAATDKDYQNIVQLINAMALTEGEAKYASLINYINSGISRYKRQILGQKSAASNNDRTGGNGDDPTSGTDQPGDGGSSGGYDGDLQ
jgi:hypothetical protein